MHDIKLLCGLLVAFLAFLGLVVVLLLVVLSETVKRLTGLVRTSTEAGTTDKTLNTNVDQIANRIDSIINNAKGRMLDEIFRTTVGDQPPA